MRGQHGLGKEMCHDGSGERGSKEQKLRPLSKPGLKNSVFQVLSEKIVTAVLHFSDKKTELREINLLSFLFYT